MVNPAVTAGSEGVGLLSGSDLNGLRSLDLPDNEPLFTFQNMSKMTFFDNGIVYALCGANRKIFYIGYSMKPHKRFSDRSKYTSNIAVMRRMKECGDDLRVAIIASCGQRHQLLKLECDLIMYHSNALLNKQMNGFQNSTMIAKRYHRINT